MIEITVWKGKSIDVEKDNFNTLFVSFIKYKEEKLMRYCFWSDKIVLTKINEKVKLS